MANLKEFHVALSAALTNIVQRWVIDEEADLPSRMPLEPHEEDILRVRSFALLSFSHLLGVVPNPDKILKYAVDTQNHSRQIIPRV
jgi:hypothetical protein